MRCRRAAAWLLALPLMAASSQVAHVLAYRIVYPEAGVRVQQLIASGHGYMAYAPLLIGLGVALELVAFASVAGDRAHRRRHVSVSPWLFALLPPLGFTLQEFLERWLAGTPFPWWMVLQPTFRIGLLLQLPFALVAFVLARWLLRVADRVASALRRDERGPRTSEPAARRPTFVAHLPRVAVLADGHAGRGPPLAARRRPLFSAAS